MASVSCHHSSYQTYPGGEPISLATLCHSIYSLKSTLTKAFLSENSSSASAFAVWVFHTQVGQRKRKLQMGRLSSLSHALFLCIASDTILKASSCHTTFFCSLSRRCRYFSFSCSTSLPTGIHVHLETMLAISSASTLSLRYESHFFWFS